MEQYLAHSANPNGATQLLRDHLVNVAHMCEQYGSQLAMQESAYVAGLFHDAGKYSELFQQVLAGKASKVDHSTPGAWIALAEYQDIAAGLAIQGHHIGLQKADKQSLLAICPATHKDGRSTLSVTDTSLVHQRMEADGLSCKKHAHMAVNHNRRLSNVDTMLDVRMLLSCLVDADYRDTNRHFSGTDQDPAPRLNAQLMLDTLESHLANLNQCNKSSDDIKNVRTLLSDECSVAADQSTGCFTLTAPTGTGKTLAMLRFALKHAIYNQLSRIIVVIPYLSIIDQTAKIYKELFRGVCGDRFLIEDHSLAKGGNHETKTDAVLAEAWDAPVIITTSVQMLESLFSNRPSQCRKLHNIAHSVIMFDEVQTLPTSLATVTTSALAYLSQRYHSSVVYSTATQPAFNHLSQRRDTSVFPTEWAPKEIVKSRDELFQNTRRVTVNWPKERKHMSWSELAQEVSQHEQSLTIVNLKEHAQHLVSELRSLVVNALHLSTSMCMAHRISVLKQVSTALGNNEPVTLVSTQCIEAGVDVDFPHVFRAMADLSSIAQAAGRCNRNGKLSNGVVDVFIPDDEAYPPSGGYRQAAEVCKSMLQEHGMGSLDINNPNIYREYYHLLYEVQSTDNMDLHNAITRIDFKDVANEYKLIDQDTISVLVPYKADADDDTFERLAGEARSTGISSRWVREARERSVQLYRNAAGACYLEPLYVAHSHDACEWYIYTENSHYDLVLGLVTPSEQLFIA